MVVSVAVSVFASSSLTPRRWICLARGDIDGDGHNLKVGLSDHEPLVERTGNGAYGQGRSEKDGGAHVVLLARARVL